jgi:hypothetical protein
MGLVRSHDRVLSRGCSVCVSRKRQVRSRLELEVHAASLIAMQRVGAGTEQQAIKQPLVLEYQLSFSTNR